MTFRIFIIGTKNIHFVLKIDSIFLIEGDTIRMTKKKTREAEPGELRGIALLETLEKFFKRPETRIDAQRILSSLSKDGQTYAKHLVMSGPLGNVAAAKACGFTLEQLEASASELEKAVRSLMG